MATLWFEEDDDPMVIDATGAITRWMLPFSELSGWRPLRVFNETLEFSVLEVESPVARNQTAAD